MAFVTPMIIPTGTSSATFPLISPFVPYTSTTVRNKHHPQFLYVNTEIGLSDADKEKIKDIDFPLITFPTPFAIEYDNVNNDARLQRRSVKRVYENTLNYWLRSELDEILNMFNVKGGRVVVSKNPRTHRQNTDNDRVRAMKIDHIRQHYFRPSDAKRLVHKYIRKYNSNYYDLTNEEDLLIDFLKVQLMKAIRRR